MARVTLIDERGRPELAELTARIRGARGDRLLNLYRVLLHSPDMAAGWLEFNNTTRFRTKIADGLRELAIMRVAILNGADYVLQIHGSRYAEKAGITQSQVAALAGWPEASVFSPEQRVLLAYVDAITRDVEVPDEVFAGLAAHFDERQIVELTVLIGAYNMHTRVLRALRVEPEAT